MRYTFQFLIALCMIVALFAVPPSVLATTYLFQTVDYPGTGIPRTWLTGINNTGEIVGAYHDQNSVPHAFVYSGVFFSVSPPPQTAYFDINDTGQIVGETSDSQGVHGHVRSGGTVSPPIDFPNAVFTEFLGVNNAGQIVGVYGISGSMPHALLYSGGTFSPPLNIPGATGSIAQGINDSGIIVGQFDDASGSAHGFVLNSTGMTPLDAPFSSRTEAWGINNTGHVVGCYIWAGAPGSYYPFVWQGGIFSMFYVPLADSACALKINDGGQIVGYYLDGTGTHGFVATPVPDNDVPLVLSCLHYWYLCYGVQHPWDPPLIKPDPQPRFLPIRPIEGQERIDCQVKKRLCQALTTVLRAEKVRPGAAPKAMLLSTSPVDKPRAIERPFKK